MTLPALSSRLKAIQPSPTLAMTNRARQMAAAGIDVVSFAAGEPDFDTPGEVCEAAIAAIRAGKTKYTSSSGLVECREAIAAKLKRENGLSYSPDQIIVSCGAKHSVYNSLMAILEPGEEVILLAPYWMTYAEQVRMAGGVPVIIECSADNGYAPTEEDLRISITPRTKAIIVNSPCNPTGAVLPRAILKLIGALAIRNNFWIIADEIYEHLTYGIEHVSIASLGEDVKARTITVNGCSKSYAMTGWRVGYLAAPVEVASAVSCIQDQVTSNVTTFAQIGAITALNMDHAVVEEMRAEFQTRRELMVEGLNLIPGVRCQLPQGAFYAFASVSALLTPGETDVQLANELLENAHVACIPGSVFRGDGHLRLSYATSRQNIEKGIERLQIALTERQA